MSLKTTQRLLPGVRLEVDLRILGEEPTETTSKGQRVMEGWGGGKLDVRRSGLNTGRHGGRRVRSYRQRGDVGGSGKEKPISKKTVLVGVAQDQPQVVARIEGL